MSIRHTLEAQILDLWCEGIGIQTIARKLNIEDEEEVADVVESPGNYTPESICFETGGAE